MVPVTTPVRRVLVLRALMLGDLLCATPALRALRRGLPGAHVTLVGLPWARELASRLPSVDDFEALHGWPGLPELPERDPHDRPRLLARLRARRADLALQLHGSGGIVNPLVAAFGARRMAAFTDGRPWAAPAGTLQVPWPSHGREVERLLRLTDAMGCPRDGSQLDLPLHEADHRAAAGLLHAAGLPPDARPVVVHPGAQLSSRRWPAASFATVVRALSDLGRTVVLTGGADEIALTAEVARQVQPQRGAVIDLAGRTSLWTLGALLRRSALLVANDTGLSHVAAALGTPSVIVASGSDVARWAPEDASRHQVLWHDTPCRPCAHRQCPWPDHPCARGVGTEAVLHAVRHALQTAPPPALSITARPLETLDA